MGRAAGKTRLEICIMPTATWTRGQLWDKIVEQAQKNPKYHQQLMSDPRSLMEKQLGTVIPKSVNIKVLEEANDTYYIVLPATAKEGAELSDSDLEKVAGGGTVKGNASCNNAQGSAIGVTVVDVKLV
jgi:Nitrile hydratase, alpha chain